MNKVDYNGQTKTWECSLVGCIQMLR